MKLVSYAHAYRQNSVQTAGPGHLILMLFDGALRFMSLALLGFEETSVIERNEIVHINLVKTQAIVDELQSSLNLEAGGEFAENLSRLYDYFRHQLREANLRKNPAPARVVVELLGEIRAAWAAMLDPQENGVIEPPAWTATAA
jgi:flagellar protein FliS